MEWMFVSLKKGKWWREWI